MVCFHGFANRSLALTLPVISTTISDLQRKRSAEASFFPHIFATSRLSANRICEDYGFLFPWHFGMTSENTLGAKG